MRNLIIITTIFLSGQLTAQIPTAGLAGYRSFDGHANDLSGNNNNGTVYNAVPVCDRFGNPQRAYYFNGIYARIVVRLVKVPLH